MASKRNATQCVLGGTPPFNGDEEDNLGEIALVEEEDSVTGDSGLMYLICPATWKPLDMEMQAEICAGSPRYVVTRALTQTTGDASPTLLPPIQV